MFLFCRLAPYFGAETLNNLCSRLALDEVFPLRIANWDTEIMHWLRPTLSEHMEYV